MSCAQPHVLLARQVLAAVCISPLACGKYTLLVMIFSPHKVWMKAPHTELGFNCDCLPFLGTHPDKVGATSYIVAEVVGEKVVGNTLGTEKMTNPAVFKSFWLLEEDRCIVSSQVT